MRFGSNMRGLCRIGSIPFVAMLVCFTGCSQDVTKGPPLVAPAEVPSDSGSVAGPAQLPVNESSTSAVTASDRDLSATDQDSELISVSPPKPMELIDAASVALEDGDIDQAFQIARQAYRVAPDQLEVAFMMARLLGERRRFHEAIDMLDQLSKDHPNMRLPILGQTAEWMVKAGLWKDAEDRYIEILRQVPNAAIVHRNLAELYVRQGQRLKAAGHIDSLCRIGDVSESELRTMLRVFCPVSDTVPDTAQDETLDPIGSLGIARKESSQGKWESARKRLEPTNAGPSDSSAVQTTEAEALLARIYAKSGNVALQGFLQSESLLDHPDSWYAKGVNAASEDRHADAVRLFAKCVAVDQTDHEAYLDMSRSLEKLGMPEKAKLVAARGQLVRKTQLLGQKTGQALTQEAITELAGALEELHRPLEATAWRGVALAYAESRGSVSAKEIQSAITKLNQDRSDYLASGKTMPDRDFVLCGIDVERLPDNTKKISSGKPGQTPEPSSE